MDYNRYDRAAGMIGEAPHLSNVTGRVSARGSGICGQAGGGCCRLCGGETTRLFALLVLGEIECAYFRCRECESLQTEWPTWIERAYESSLTRLDTGAADRCLLNRSRVWWLSRVLGVKSILDFGGGDGLLTRLLRDVGLESRVCDKFAIPTYAAPFQHRPGTRYDLVCAFEVLEHLVEPEKELPAIFEPAAKHILVSTLVYKGQDKTWWYLAPLTGQHVFFYSRRALRLIGQRFDCSVTFLGDHILFSRTPLNRRERFLLRLARSPKFRRGLCVYMAVKPKKGIMKDFDRLAAEGAARSQ